MESNHDPILTHEQRSDSTTLCGLSVDDQTEPMYIAGQCGLTGRIYPATCVVCRAIKEGKVYHE